MPRQRPRGRRSASRPPPPLFVSRPNGPGTRTGRRRRRRSVRDRSPPRQHVCRAAAGPGSPACGLHRGGPSEAEPANNSRLAKPTQPEAECDDSGSACLTVAIPGSSISRLLRCHPWRPLQRSGRTAGARRKKTMSTEGDAATKNADRREARGRRTSRFVCLGRHTRTPGRPRLRIGSRPAGYQDIVQELSEAKRWM